MEAAARPRRSTLVTIKRILAAILLILTGHVFYVAQDVIMPTVLGILFALTLRPIVRTGEKFHVPAALSSALLVPAVALFIALGIWSLREPATQMIESAPQIGSQLELRFAEYREQLRAFRDATKKVEEIANGTTEPAAQRVVVEQPALLASAASSLVSGMTSLGVALLLALFLLSTGTLFYEKIIGVMPLLSEKKRALRVLYDVERQVSRYLLTITLINIGLGVVIGVALSLYGMENAFLWGVIATALNFLPFIGALAGIAAIGATAIVSYPTLGEALAVPGIYFLCTAIEGNLITPMIVGRRLELNIVVVFLAVSFWGWMWGIAGVLMAVPILAVFKVICDHFEGMNAIGDFLTVRTGEAPDDSARTEESAPAARQVRG